MCECMYGHWTYNKCINTKVQMLMKLSNFFLVKKLYNIQFVYQPKSFIHMKILINGSYNNPQKI